MNWTRRRIVSAASLAATFALAACATPRGVGGTPSSDLLYIGTQGTQIQAARIDTRTGDLTLVGPVGDLDRPTWTVRHPRLPILYAVSEVAEDGEVVAFRIDPLTGALAKIGKAGTGGGGPTHLWFDTKSSTLLAANYNAGSVASIAVHADGTIEGPVSVIKASGVGPHRRQQSPHAHGVSVDPSGRYALVADLGVDKLFVYPLDPRTHRLREAGPDGPHHLSLPPGSGPRHFAFHPAGRFAYLLGELTSEIFTLDWDVKTGRFHQIHTLPLDLPGATDNPSVAEVAVSRDGRFVYASNRGDSSIVVHAIDQRTGLLRQVQRIKSGGENPWSFTLHPGGRWMIVANQRSDSLNLFGVDPRTGLLTDTGKALSISKPVSIAFDRLR